MYEKKQLIAYSLVFLNYCVMCITFNFFNLGNCRLLKTKSPMVVMYSVLGILPV